MLRTLEALATALDPSLLMEDLGLAPDPWQRAVLRSGAPRLLLLCARQMGKSTASSVIALHEAIYRPGALVLLVSPSQRQSGELFRKVAEFYHDLGRPLGTVEDSATTLTLANGSRIVSLPGNPATIRGYSAPSLVIVDEAAIVEDALMVALTPMLAVSRGRLACVSTPMGQRGFFFNEWTGTNPEWLRVQATADQCPRISAEFLTAERRRLGQRWYSQEYLCEFVATAGQLFSPDAVAGAFDTAAVPLFAGV